jgi:hypothetical protein
MQPTIHFAVSAVGGGAVWAVTGEPLSLPVAVASGVAIDVDFFLYRFPIAIKLLHGWEWLAALMAVGLVAGFPWWVAAAAAGYGLHIAGDQMYNQRKWWWYFLTYRTWKRYRRRATRRLAHGTIENG